MVEDLADVTTVPSSAETRVREVLDSFSRALRAEDYAFICDELYTAALADSTALGTDRCDIALEDKNPPPARVTVDTVAILGDEAVARITVSSRGSSTPSQIGLARERGLWKITVTPVP